jgi:hypothetical protein
VRLVFDRGTLLLLDPPEGFAAADLPGVVWDPRVAAHRAPAHNAYRLAATLRRRGIAISGQPHPDLKPPSAFRPVPLRPYQAAALTAWRTNRRRGLVVLPTGSGKTPIALAAMAATRTPALCLVPTRALLAQWIASLGAVYDGPIGCFGDGERGCVREAVRRADHEQVEGVLRIHPVDPVALGRLGDLGGRRRPVLNG